MIAFPKVGDDDVTEDVNAEAHDLFADGLLRLEDRYPHIKPGELAHQLLIEFACVAGCTPLLDVIIALPGEDTEYYVAKAR